MVHVFLRGFTSPSFLFLVGLIFHFVVAHASAVIFVRKIHMFVGQECKQSKNINLDFIVCKFLLTKNVGSMRSYRDFSLMYDMLLFTRWN
jgi:hypothetical protein